MRITTQQSMSGFIASHPKLTFTDKGIARFAARVGQEHYQHNDDDTYTKLDTSYHHLVVFNKTAERAFETFSKGDQFVAEGYVRHYTYNSDGLATQREEFVAKRIGHDTMLTRYQVDRSRREQPGTAPDGTTPDVAPPSSKAHPHQRKARLAESNPSTPRPAPPAPTIPPATL